MNSNVFLKQADSIFVSFGKLAKLAEITENFAVRRTKNVPCLFAKNCTLTQKQRCEKTAWKSQHNNVPPSFSISPSQKSYDKKQRTQCEIIGLKPPQGRDRHVPLRFPPVRRNRSFLPDHRRSRHSDNGFQLRSDRRTAMDDDNWDASCGRACWCDRSGSGTAEEGARDVSGGVFKIPSEFGRSSANRGLNFQTLLRPSFDWLEGLNICSRLVDWPDCWKHFCKFSKSDGTELCFEVTQFGLWSLDAGKGTAVRYQFGAVAARSFLITSVSMLRIFWITWF